MRQEGVSKAFKREVSINPRLVISTCTICARKAASTDLRLLVLAETLHECSEKVRARFANGREPPRDRGKHSST